ncbi:hypothetical protein ACO1O0_002556 [Amphichorda felina]
MKFFAAVALLAAAAMAAPTEVEDRGEYVPCGSTLYSNTLCCATDALGIIGLDCEVPSETPCDADHFAEICAQKGQQPKCCVAPVADQALLCDNPVGI